MENERGEGWAGKLACGQGIFYIASGVWPLVSFKTFEKVTGRKKEPWLVKTVGCLLAGWGALMIGGARRPSRFVAATAATPAVLMAGVDVWYAGVRRCISPVYLADAVVEVAFVLGWAAVSFGARAAPSGR